MLGRQVIWNPLLKASTQLWRNRKFFLLNSGKKNISELKENNAKWVQGNENSSKLRRSVVSDCFSYSGVYR